MQHKLYKGDCLEIMKNIKDKSIDMILCDLPYGTTACKWDNIIPLNDYVIFKNKQYTHDEFILYCIKKNAFNTLDEIKNYFNTNKQEGLWTYYNRIIKDNGAIVLFGSEPFTSKLIASNINNFRHEWIYQKTVPSNFAQAKYAPMKEHENIIIFGNKKCNYYPIKEERRRDGVGRIKRTFTKATGSKCGNFVNNMYSENYLYKPEELRYPSSVKIFNNRSKGNTGLHPTQKPVELLEYLIKTYSKENELILDNCMGSNSTGIACLNTNRNYIGIEKDDTYFDVCVNRTNKHIEDNNINCELEVNE